MERKRYKYMDYKTVLENLNGVLVALNSITVNGKQNLNNLLGSISVLEEIAKDISIEYQSSTNGN